MENQVETIKYTPEKAKQNALAKLDLIRKWQEFRRKAVNKLQADYDFVKLHNSSDSYLFTVLGKISRGSLHRWKSMLDGTEDYTRLIPNYKYVSVNEYRTCLTDEEIKIFMGLLLHPNRICIGKAIALTKYKLKEQGQSFIPADITFRRYAKWFKENNYDKWVLARDGEKALSDKVEPYIKRDASLLDVGDILVADGHKLAFQVINPFTGKPCRATLVGFLDWKSTALVGYEIMLEENTQNIASALRNAILNLGKIPKFVYLDNGRAFRGKYFMGSPAFCEIGLKGIYEKLGITTIFANPYNARTKVIERFFLEMQESFEKLLPSYIGTSIENKPARLKRNEKFHCAIHTEFIPTIQQTIQMINSWLLYKNSLPCPNDKSKTIQEMFNGVNKDKINDNELDDLMLAQEIKTISSQGIRFLNSWYFNDALYGIRQKVIIKYSLFDLSYINIYTMSGKFLCRADRITLTHPLAHYTGEIEDIEDYKQKIQKQKQLKNKTIKACKEFLNIEDLEILKCDIEDYDQSGEKATCNLIESKHAEGKEEVHTAVVSSKIKKTKEKPQKYNPKVKPLFRTSREKYEYLMKYGCTCNEDRAWLASYKKSKEYLEYETQICTY